VPGLWLTHSHKSPRQDLWSLDSDCGKLASKKPGKSSRSRSRPRSRARSRSRSHTKDKKEPDWEYFVVPLSGILSCIAARLFDMGGGIPNSQDQRDAERTPLLPDSERSQREEPAAPARKAARWVARNAVTVFMSLLVLAIILGLCLFFGSKLSAADLRVHSKYGGSD